MIFDRFFTPSYRSDKPEQRLKAIETLSPEKPQDNTILHELAFNDESNDVTLAALYRLNSFALWQKMSVTAYSERIKREASRQVEKILKGEVDTPISDAERRAFLKETANTALLGELLVNLTSLHDDLALIAELLEKADSTALTQQLFLITPNPALQQYIIDNTTDTELLNRLLRKVDDDGLRKQVSERIEALVLLEQKPVELKKALTLCLSKLQALLDKNHYPEVDEKAKALEQQFQTLFAEKACLSDAEQQQTERKHQRIAGQILRHRERLKPQWEAEQAGQRVEQLADDAATKRASLRQAMHTLYEEQLTRATNTELTTVAHLASDLKETVSALETLKPDHPSLGKLHAAVSEANTRLAQFEEQQQAGARALAQLDAAEAFVDALTDEQLKQAETRLLADNFAAQWREASASLHTVPATWSKRWQSLWSQWQRRIKAVDATQQAQLKQCRKQLNIIDNQIENGHFRAAMRGFENAKAQFEALPEAARQTLSRRMAQTEAAVERLEGWQSYLATPRKPALLDEAKSLAETEPADITKRADAIRYLRKQWLSLGQPNESGDMALDAQFDAYLETAFAPCRAFYAEQDARRNQAVDVREALLEEVAQLPDTLAPATLAKQLDALRDKWHNAGQLDAKRYRKLKARWDSALAPHQAKVNDWYRQNREAKEALIAEAKQLLEASDIDAAATQAQQLQERWKQTGHAGRRAESSLWHSFKQVNDTLFGNLKASRREAREQQSQVAKRLLDQADELVLGINERASEDIRQRLRDIEAQAVAVRGSAKRALKARLTDIDNKLQERQSRQQARARDAQYAALLTLIETWQRGRAASVVDASTYQTLGKRWRQACEADAASAYNRSWLTTALEILTSTSSPDEVREERQAVQLELLSAKLAQGEKWTLDAIIAHWLSLGPVADSEKPLAARLASVIRQQQSNKG